MLDSVNLHDELDGVAVMHMSFSNLKRLNSAKSTINSTPEIISLVIPTSVAKSVATSTLVHIGTRKSVQRITLNNILFFS